jgi:hypothetical protein
MLKNKLYSCGICDSKPDQLSHHKTHLATAKHRDKTELFTLKLSKSTKEELIEKYEIDDISLIVKNSETIVYECGEKLIQNKVNESKPSELKMSSVSQVVEESFSASNREALKEHIHDIHNFLRNNGCGYGMKALQMFNLFYGLMKIENAGLIDKIGLVRPHCEFSYLLKLANEAIEYENESKKNGEYKDLKHEGLFQIIYNETLTSINENDETKYFLFYEIPSSIKPSVISNLIKKISNITILEKTCNVLLSGKIYEYFIGRDDTAISELGAYFTDRHIVDFIYKKLSPSVNDDGTIRSMIDPFGGSGGFTTGYIQYLRDNYPDINWSKEVHKIRVLECKDIRSQLC